MNELENTSKAVVKRGDSFDIGMAPSSPEVIDIIQNPDRLIDTLSLTEEQARNVASIITASGAGLGYKFLSQHIGAELAGAVGGFLGAHIGRKLFEK